MIGRSKRMVDRKSVVLCLSIFSQGFQLKKCKHFYCDNCWYEYLKNKIESVS